MSVVRILVVISIVGFAVHWWKTEQSHTAQMREQSPNGFVSVVMPDGAPHNAVVILAPVNCPSDAAQRADALASQLTQMGIPNIRSASYSANIDNATDEQNAAMQRAVAVLNGEVPAVFLKGMGKANPTVDEVVAEYRGAR